MPNLIELKRDRALALNQAQEIIQGAENAKRDLTGTEESAYRHQMSIYAAKTAEIEGVVRNNTVSTLWPNGMPGAFAPTGLIEAPSTPPSAFRLAEARNPAYAEALHAFLKTGGKAHGEELTAGADGVGGYHVPGSEAYTRQRLPNGNMSAALYEGSEGGSDGAGGYTVSVPTEQLVVPLALPDLGIFDAATVIATATDVKIPQQASFGTSALKAESNTTIATFGGTDPTLGQITLSAFMAGAARTVSWELLQDVKTFQEFVVTDLLAGQRILEDSLLAAGTGTGQAQGVFGNTGNGTGTPYELTGAATDGQLLLDSLFDVSSTLKAAYQPGASWIMSRATALTIRRAQMQANLFIPVVTVDPDGTTRILGRPVYFDVNAPALPTATSAGVIPILFGDFKQGYIIGVRGGGGINVKILDQIGATQGQLVILAYRRLDGRVRRSEAIQAITISHS